MLLESGADVNIRDEYGNSPLILAAENGHTECIAVLVEAGAEVNTVNKYDNSALMMTSRNGSVDCVKLLIEDGADVNMKQTSTSGYSALYYATRTRHDKCVVTLLKAGANVNISNQYTFCDCPEMSKAERDLMIYAAGQGGSCSHLSDLEPKEICLMSLCRAAIRNRLLGLNPHENLFVRIPRLGLPSSLTKYLLYDVSTDEKDWRNEDNFSAACICDLMNGLFFDQRNHRQHIAMFKLLPREFPYVA